MSMRENTHREELRHKVFLLEGTDGFSSNQKSKVMIEFSNLQGRGFQLRKLALFITVVFVRRYFDSFAPMLPTLFSSLLLLESS